VRVIRERIVSGAVPSELIRRILPSREFKSCAPAAQRAVPVVIQSLPSGPILIRPPSWMLAPECRPPGSNPSGSTAIPHQSALAGLEASGVNPPSRPADAAGPRPHRPPARCQAPGASKVEVEPDPHFPRDNIDARDVDWAR